MRQALVPSVTNLPSQDAKATADVREFTPGHYRIHYQSATASLLRVSNAYFPGWIARSGGQDLAVLPVDYALMGVVVPAGQGDVVLDYHSTYFFAAGIVTLVALLACVALLVLDLRKISI